MINYYEKIDFSQTVYTIADDLSGIEEHDLESISREYADVTTTPQGVAPRNYVDGNELRTWGHRGNNEALEFDFETNEQAEHGLLLSHLYDLEHDINAPTVFYARAEAEASLAEILGETGRENGKSSRSVVIFTNPGQL